MNKSRNNHATITQDKQKPSDLFEGENSSLAKTFKDSNNPMDRVFIEFFESQGFTFVDVTPKPKQCPKKKE
jgi:hypothetical protein